MSEQNAGVLVADPQAEADAQDERDDRWLSAMTKIYSCVVAGGLFNDGASADAIALAEDLIEALSNAVMEAKR
jgi:hypothetical protein